MTFQPEEVSKASFEELLAFLQTKGAGAPADSNAAAAAAAIATGLTIRRGPLVGDAGAHAASSAESNPAQVQNLTQTPRNLTIPLPPRPVEAMIVDSIPTEDAAIQHPTKEAQPVKPLLEPVKAVATMKTNGIDEALKKVSAVIKERSIDDKTRSPRAADDKDKTGRDRADDKAVRAAEDKATQRMIDAQGRRLISDIKHLFDQKQSDAATEIRQMNEQLEHKVARIHELETQYRNSIQSLKVLEMEATQATQRLAAGMKAVFAISEALMVENFQMVQTTRERSSLHKLKPMNDALVTGVVSHVEKAFDGLNVDRDGYGRDLRNRLRNGDDRNDRDGRGRIGGRDGRDNDRKRSRSSSRGRGGRSRSRSTSRKRHQSRSPRRNGRNRHSSRSPARERERIPARWNSYRPE